MQVTIGGNSAGSVPFWVVFAWAFCLYYSPNGDTLLITTSRITLIWVLQLCFVDYMAEFLPEIILSKRMSELRPVFEGRESEQNWNKREQNVILLRSMCHELTPRTMPTFLKTIRGMLDGLLKTVNSLRTTVSTNGCLFFQDLAVECGPGIDNMVEILLQNLIKLCANTKPIARTNGNDTVLAIIGHVSYHLRIVQHIHNACQDKNVQPRRFACEWLKKVIKRHPRSTIEHHGGLELIEHSIKLGLEDRDKDVREAMRPTYWNFARRWPERSEAIMSSLDKIKQDQLLADPSNPNPVPQLSPSKANSSIKLSNSTGSGSSKPTLKEAKARLAAQNKAPSPTEDSNIAANAPHSTGSAPSKPSLKDFKAKLRAEHKAATPMLDPHVTAQIPPSEAQAPKTGNLSAAPLRRKKALAANAAAVDAKGNEMEPSTAATATKPTPVEAKPSKPEANTAGTATNFLENALIRLQNHSLDGHGFRRLQAVLHDDIDNPAYSRLITPLCEWIANPSERQQALDWHDLQAQALATIRLLVTRPPLIKESSNEILKALLLARQHYSTQAPMVTGIRRTLSIIIADCNVLECLGTLCSFIDMPHAETTEEIAILSLGALLHRIHEFDDVEAKFFQELSEEQRMISRLGRIGSTALKSEFASIRKAAMAFAQEFWYVAPKDDYWNLMAPDDREAQGLLKYYIARHQKFQDHIDL